MNNDVAEEALRGLYLVEGRHIEPMTFAVGNSAETLYLYLVGAAAQLSDQPRSRFNWSVGYLLWPAFG